MTLTVKFYSYDDRPGSVEVGELRWTEGGKVEIVSGIGMEFFAESPIMVRQGGELRKVSPDSDPEAFMRGLAGAYAGHFYASPAKETK